MRRPTRDRLWTPQDAPTPADSWYDVAEPGGILRGVNTGVNLIRDWGNQGRHLVGLAAAADQGSLSKHGPGGGWSIECDNNFSRWIYQGSMGAGTDHTIVCGVNLTAVPAGVPIVCLAGGYNGGVPKALGTDNHHLGIRDAGGWHLSNLELHTGVHAYSAVIAGATATAWLYEDTTKAAATVACVADAFLTSFQFGGLAGIGAALAGAVFRLAYWNSQVSDTTLRLAQAWAVRDDG
jgi:hypothetical protein